MDDMGKPLFQSLLLQCSNIDRRTGLKVTLILFFLVCFLLFYFVCMCALPECMFVNHVSSVPLEARRRGHQIPWSYSNG